MTCPLNQAQNPHEPLICYEMFKLVFCKLVLSVSQQCLTADYTRTLSLHMAKQIQIFFAYLLQEVDITLFEVSMEMMEDSF